MTKPKDPKQGYYMVIDVTTVESTCLLKITDLRRAALWGHIYKNQGRKVIAPPMLGRGFAMLEKLPLQYFYWNVCQETPPEDYAELVQKCLAKLQVTEEDEDSFEVLMREITRLGIDLEDPTNNAKKESAAPKDLNAPPLRPRERSTTGLVWELADAEFVKAGNQMPARQAVIEACLAEEINPATAATQYAKWAKAKKASSI